jgi:hypothetical protein
MSIISTGFVYIATEPTILKLRSRKDRCISTLNSGGLHGTYGKGWPGTLQSLTLARHALRLYVMRAAIPEMVIGD